MPNKVIQFLIEFFPLGVTGIKDFTNIIFHIDNVAVSSSKGAFNHKLPEFGDEVPRHPNETANDAKQEKTPHKQYQEIKSEELGNDVKEVLHRIAGTFI